MGTHFFDQYSLLHFAVGVLFYFWGVSATNTFIIHVFFELIENTTLGMYFINNYIKVWPGGKPYPDSVLNSIGDTFFTMLGFYVSKWLEQKSAEYKWYEPHIND